MTSRQFSILRDTPIRERAACLAELNPTDLSDYRKMLRASTWGTNKQRQLYIINRNRLVQVARLRDELANPSLNESARTSLENAIAKLEGQI
tara:strand:+ start:210 stop:485 length:276 start_codon:yes stop_codon:yes gene_type:complete